MNALFVIFGVLAYVVILIFSITQLSWPVTIILALLPPLAITVTSRALFLLLPIATLHIGMLVPGLPGNFQLHMIFALLYILLYVASFAITKPHRTSSSSHMEYLCALFLIGWIILLIGVRGSGMRVLGSKEIGGATYFQALIALGYFLFTRREIATEKDLRRAGILMGFLCLLPTAASGLFELSGGAIWQQMMFFRQGAAFGETAQAVAEQRASRLSFLSNSTALLWVAVFTGRPGRLTWFSKVIWWLISCIAALFSGFRSTVITSFAFFSIYGLLKSKSRLRYATMIGLVGLTGYIGLVISANKLPFPVQRVIASLPGMNVEWEARAQGLGTVIWRKSVWDLAIRDIEKYWYLGRGVTFNPDTIPLMERYTNDPYVAYVTGSFHHATLELLVLYGAPAFLACCLMYLGFIRRSISFQLRKKWNNPHLQEWALCILLYVTLRTVISFSFGISAELLVVLPLWLAFYNMIRNSDDAMAPRS